MIGPKPKSFGFVVFGPRRDRKLRKAISSADLAGKWLEEHGFDCYPLGNAENGTPARITREYCAFRQTYVRERNMKGTIRPTSVQLEKSEYCRSGECKEGKHTLVILRRKK